MAFLLWLWLSNMAILAGGVLDTEVERARQLRAGVPAQERLQLELRDDRLIRLNSDQRESDVRASAGHAARPVGGRRRVNPVVRKLGATPTQHPRSIDGVRWGTWALNRSPCRSVARSIPTGSPRRRSGCRPA